ncbi:kinetochore protein Spc24 [Salarias fasciatus]|uniref:Kinetochore protein Spc24 n=1 Tax=Salarias fasciatus TaxID=181472 RepID=A0A672FLH3_SALFA|nr:kinetochore protein Spc24 [Salarias fasciatus]XP_029945746.1 kinetochore protein Spc24 [Salarias fasciatus]
MAQRHDFQDLEETAEALVAFINNSQPERLKRVRKEQQALGDCQAESVKTVTQILNDVARVEENMSQMLLDSEQRSNAREEELQSLEEQLRQSRARSQTADSELQLLQRELDHLRSTEAELAALQSEVDEDTTEVIPSSVYVAQLYHVITRIKWEYGSAPGLLEGVHYGADLATPISIDTSTRSRWDVSDQLWGFVGLQ